MMEMMRQMAEMDLFEALRPYLVTEGILLESDRDAPVRTDLMKVCVRRARRAVDRASAPRPRG